jgi:hypothetical protein
MPVVKHFCRECYSEPQAVYETLKKAGMDLVTITDHDSIEAAERLRRYPDFFVSEEVTCHLPSGTEAHIGATTSRSATIWRSSGGATICRRCSRT